MLLPFWSQQSHSQRRLDPVLVHAQRWGGMLGEGSLAEPAAPRAESCPCTSFLQGNGPRQHHYLAGLSQGVPPISVQGGGGGSELRAKSNSGAEVTRETAPAWLRMGKFRCCFNGTPASITLSGDTFKKKKGFQTTQFLHLHKNK